MKQWSIWWRSPDLYETRAYMSAYEVPWWKVAAETTFEKLDAYVFRHRLCSPPNFLWKIGNEDHSVGSLLYNISNWFLCVEIRGRKNELNVNLDDEWLEKNGQKPPRFVDDEED